jgi:phosphohistidine phosphatase SixA
VTTPIYVIRHAKAGDRERWTGPDELRPLTDAGWRQANGLVERLAGRPLTRILSSPYVRCVQTMEPLADEREIPVEAISELGEGMAFDLLEKVAVGASASGPAALSVHGDVLRALVDDLRERGVLSGNGRGDVRKGCIWIVQVHRGGIVDARYVAPPPSGPDAETSRD